VASCPLTGIVFGPTVGPEGIMARWLRASAVCVALVAIVTRALVPVGWMPNMTGFGPLIVMCSKDGPVPFPFDPGSKSPKHDPSHDGDHHTVCPFNAAPHFAVSASATTVAEVPAEFVGTPLIPASTSLRSVRRHEPQSPRAPPYPV
jgi:hypothetical protein